ncbi:AAA family ATPase [Salmonella enterica]|uniref:AAA family ATPase n=1 Tax=Salmonella enterica TaxID=28901 RepID=UPI0026DD35F0|nr:AAA family ATPase [Salmonella enterica]MDO3853901.1 AAA family ATPase [Salmonella enterica]MDO3917269.1 AAA family ATPase [Salmonella enterica]
MNTPIRMAVDWNAKPGNGYHFYDENDNRVGPLYQFIKDNRIKMVIDWNAKPFEYEETLDENGDVIEWTDENGIRYDAFGNAIPTKILCAIEKEEIKLQSEKRLRPIIENLFNRKQVGFLYGESNTGKSFAALSLLNRVAQGRPWSGLRVAKECHAFYFDGETGVEVKDRNTAWSKKFNGGIKNERMHILSPQINLFDVGVQNIIISDINSITNNKGGIICFDTLSSFLAYYSKQCIDGKTTLDMDNPDENDAIAMRKLVSILKRIAVETNSFVLMVHHGGKDAAKGMKGAITLKNDCDTVIKLAASDRQAGDDDIAFSVSLTVEKNRSAAKLPVMEFNLCLEDNGITQQELHEIDNELCDYPDEGETGYEVKNSTKTLVFIDKPNKINNDEKTNKGGALPGRKQADDESLDAKLSRRNKYAQAHTHHHPPMTQQQQQETIETNRSNGETRVVASGFTGEARVKNNDSYIMYMNTLKKLKDAPLQKELYEKIYGEISDNKYISAINLDIFINKEEKTIGKRKDVIKKALIEMVKKNAIVIDNKTISLPKPPTPIMTDI